MMGAGSDGIKQGQVLTFAEANNLPHGSEIEIDGVTYRRHFGRWQLGGVDHEELIEITPLTKMVFVCGPPSENESDSKDGEKVLSLRASVVDMGLSLSALGLYAILAGFADGEHVSTSVVCEKTRSGKCSVLSAKAELEAAGLLVVVQGRSETGARFSSGTWALTRKGN